MNLRLRLITAACLLALGITGRNSYAVVIAADSFDYATGNLAAQNGGIGFSTAWTAGTAQVQTPGLTYPSLTSAGNKVFVSGSNQTWRQLSEAQGASDSTLWISFIGQRAGTDFVRFFGVSFYQGDVATSANERLTIGENSNNSGDTWGAHFTSAAGGRVEVANAPITTQSLLLAKINYHASGNDDFSMWVNPNLSLGEAGLGTPGASSVGLFNLAFDRLSLRAGTASGGFPAAQAFYDEIRLGTTFTDVTTSMASCALGDADCDGDADLVDFEAIRSHFRKTVTLRSDGDLVSNGVVDFADFTQWKTAFTSGGGSTAGLNLDFSAVPEPSALCIVLVGTVALGSSPRRRLKFST
jgi:hypothetical protein